MTPEQKVRAYYALFWEASESRINQLIHEDYLLEDEQLGVAGLGREAFHTYFVPGGRRAYPVTVIGYFGDDRAGVAHLRVRWPTKYVAPAWGLSGTDEEIEFEAVTLITFRDGKIASDRASEEIASDLRCDSNVVIMAIDHLRSAHLLEGKDPSLVSRRSAVRKVARLAAAGVVLPVVSSIAAPMPAMALSGCVSSSGSWSSCSGSGSG